MGVDVTTMRIINQKKYKEYYSEILEKNLDLIQEIKSFCSNF